MGSDDGDNGAVTPDQTDMLPQGRRVIGFACEMGQGGRGQCEENQDLGNKLGDVLKFWRQNLHNKSFSVIFHFIITLFL